MSEIFRKRLDALIERDGVKITAEKYGVSASTVRNWRSGRTQPQDSGIQRRITSNGRRLTGSATQVRSQKLGTISWKQYDKEERAVIEEAFKTQETSEFTGKKRGFTDAQEGLFRERFENDLIRLKRDLKFAETETDRRIIQDRIDNFTEERIGFLQELSDLYDRARFTDDSDDWQDYRDAYSTD